MPLRVRALAVLLVAAALMGAPALRNRAAGSPQQGHRVQKRAISYPKGRSRTAAHSAPALARPERAITDPPRPTRLWPERTGCRALEARADRAAAPREDLLELPRPPLRC
jgi:hypothetical protein